MDPAQARAAELRTLLRGMYVWPRRGAMALVALGAVGIYLGNDANRPMVWAGWGVVAVGWAIAAWTMAKRTAFAQAWLAERPLSKMPPR